MGEKDGSLSRRAEQTGKIIQNPTRYKVCLGCESIVAIKVTLCPNCHGYRYDQDQAAVISQAKILGQREQRSVVASDLDL